MAGDTEMGLPDPEFHRGICLSTPSTVSVPLGFVPVTASSSFSHARHERFFEADTFRHVFEAVVGACVGEGLVGGKSSSVDASYIKADKVFEVDPLICPSCNSEMRIISFIVDRQVLRKILEHLGVYHDLPERKRAPPLDQAVTGPAVSVEPVDDGWPSYEEPWANVRA